jgi:WD40 repeat protein
LWNPATGAVIRDWDTGLGGVRLLTFLPDGRLVSGGDSGVIKFWDANTGRELRRTDARTGFVLAISADGTRFGVHEFNSPVRVHEARRGRRLGTYEAGPRWFGFSLSPDGKKLATAGGGNLLLWPVPHTAN